MAELAEAVVALTARRIALGLSQRRVGFISGLGTSVCEYEAGRHAPTLPKLEAWAHSVGCDITVTPRPKARGGKEAPRPNPQPRSERQHERTDNMTEPTTTAGFTAQPVPHCFLTADGSPPDATELAEIEKLKAFLALRRETGEDAVSWETVYGSPYPEAGGVR